MLERTAAGLESRSLHRIFPFARRSFATQRALHASFWHHGAHDCELFSACNVLLRVPSPDVARPRPAKRNEGNAPVPVASSVLLDFLYPPTAARTLRRLALVMLDRTEGSVTTATSATSRLNFSSRSKRNNSKKPRKRGKRGTKEEEAEEEEDKEEERDLDEQAEEDLDTLLPNLSSTKRKSKKTHKRHEPTTETVTGQEGDLDQEANGEFESQNSNYLTRAKQTGEKNWDLDRDEMEALRGQELDLQREADGEAEAPGLKEIEDAQQTERTEQTETASSIQQDEEQTHEGFLASLGRLSEQGFFDQIWSLYQKLPHDLKEVSRVEVLLALGRSDRPAEHWRVAELFPLLDKADWTDLSIRAAVKAEIALDNFERAKWIALTALDQHGLATAQVLDSLLAYGLVSLPWDVFLEAWMPFAQRLQASQGSLHWRNATESLGEDVFENADISGSAGADVVGTTVQDLVRTQDYDPVLDEPSRETAGTPSDGTEKTGSHKKLYFLAHIPVRFEKVAAIDGLSTTIDAMYQTLNAAPRLEPVVHLRNSLHVLVQLIARTSHMFLKPTDAFSLLVRVHDPLLYQDFIDSCVDLKLTRLASKTYDKLRALPKVKIRLRVLQKMVDVFYPRDTAGMEKLRADWFQHHGVLDRRGYQKFIAFYAKRGDVASALEMWQKYLDDMPTHQSPERLAQNDNSPFTSLMHAHAVRGDIQGTLQYLEKLRALGPYAAHSSLVYAGSILLDAHAKASDYEGAMSTFADLMEREEVNQVSFGTMMGLAGSRGDLQFTLELWHMARDMNMKPDIPMTDAWVEACCQNDRLSEAEHICVQSTKSYGAGNVTVLWNTLLLHLARRRDLDSVHRVLDRMATEQVAYDEETYNNLLYALLACRQSHHAMHLLKVARESNIFEPTADQYVLLMAAFLNSSEPNQVLRLAHMMQRAGMAPTLLVTAEVIGALGKWQEMPNRKAQEWPGGYQNPAGRFFKEKALELFHRALNEYDRDEKRAKTQRDAHATERLYSRILFVLTQFGDDDAIRLVFRRFCKDGAITKESLPMRLLGSLLLSEYSRGDHSRALATWESIVEKSVRVDINVDDGRVARQCRFKLCTPLKTIQRLYVDRGDADGLMAQVKRVTDLGYELDSKNWNYYVQSLARLGQLKEAFFICEEVLMPQWTGWFRARVRDNVKNLLPLALRRIGSSPSYLRPISYTILVLAREYMNIESMAPWSHESARLFTTLEEGCPNLVVAIKSVRRSGSSLEYQLFDRNEPDRESRTPTASHKVLEALVPTDEERKEADSAVGRKTVERVLSRGKSGKSKKRAVRPVVKTAKKSSARDKRPSDRDVAHGQELRQDGLAFSEWVQSYGIPSDQPVDGHQDAGQSAEASEPEVKVLTKSGKENAKKRAKKKAKRLAAELASSAQDADDGAGGVQQSTGAVERPSIDVGQEGHETEK